MIISSPPSATAASAKYAAPFPTPPDVTLGTSWLSAKLCSPQRASVLCNVSVCRFVKLFVWCSLLISDTDSLVLQRLKGRRRRVLSLTRRRKRSGSASGLLLTSLESLFRVTPNPNPPRSQRSTPPATRGQGTVNSFCPTLKDPFHAPCCARE